ncbi:polyketide synthase Pks13 [Corynebacterium poyangense]|uniref:polyketide synthase Pks13 n=1 Tax=Corynebacterium poyangense TaxID=2684405 RepID=UPI001CCB5B56|nr:polyketide synthase Pks13 [Corynebacterium poyangense]
MTSRMDMSTQELRSWLREWVAGATGLPLDEVTEDRPLESLGLSSRDAVVLSGELENLLGTRLDATIVYEHPTIASLATRLLSGEPTAPAALPSHLPQHNATAPEIHDIAVVGMAARFPGADNGIEAMWELLVAGQDGTGPLPMGRWSEYSHDPEMSRKIDNTNNDGGFLRDIAHFDAEFFGISPLEAANTDPQQRIILELVWEALEHAHLPANELRGTDVGVFLGSSANDYQVLVSADPAEAHPYAMTGTATSIIANRVSYAFDFRGPSIAIDTACSSSLVAIHQAVRALRTGETSVALAGGVNILANPFINTAFGELGVLSPTSHIHAFSDDADGFIRGEGAGVVVLKRVADAQRDGDNILAVIRGSAVNSDGHSNGITAPNPEAQVAVLQRAYADAGINPAEVDYVEAHGTGTILGDPIEATALGAVLGQGRDMGDPLLLGSAKTNFGHTEAAAGAAGMIKVVLSLMNDTLPPSLHFSTPNRFIDFDAEHLEVVEDPREWPAYSGHRVAGVSGFGFGGTNAHVVVSDYDPARYPEHEDSDNLHAQLATPEGSTPTAAVLPVSGLLPSRRREAAEALADFLSDYGDEDLVPLARSLAKRNHGRSRAAVQASTMEEAIARLRRIAEGKTGTGIHQADSPAVMGPVFVYSGFGSQHRKMAKDLCELSPFFRRRIQELDEVVTREVGWSVMELIDDDEQTYGTETAQTSITTIQIALTDYLIKLGIRPAAVMGMSMGEIAAAYACGGLSAEDALTIASHRSRLMGEGEASLPEDQLGAMAVVELSPEQLSELNQDPQFAQVEPAVYAGPGMTTVGGPRDQVSALVEKLAAEEKFARLLQVKGAGHTSAVEPILGELAAECAMISPKPLTIPLFSSVDKGVTYPEGSVVHDPEYWTRCTRQSVHFQAATEAAFAAGHDTMVEIAPNPVALMGMMNTAFSVGQPNAKLLYVLKRKVSATDSLSDLAAKLYCAGQPVNFSWFYGPGTVLPAPHQVWKHQRYWTNARFASSSNRGLPGQRVTMPDGSVAFSTNADQAPSAGAVLEAAAAAVDPDAQVVHSVDTGDLPAEGELTCTVQRSVGGLAVDLYHIRGENSVQLVAQAFATTASSRTFLTQNAGAADSEEDQPALEQDVDPEISEEPEVEQWRWDPTSGESVEDRLRAIVSESMGYDVDDLPGELPLIDLGLDSLMGMRIKNRVENDFQIPPLQVQALRDASVADVVTMVEDLVAQRHGNAAPAQELTPDVKERPASNAAAVAPRDASERMVFGTWAGITGSAVPGVTSPLPPISEDTAERIAQRLSERAGVEINAADVLAAETLEPLANQVREGFETEVEGNIRVLRARPEGSTAPAVFMFHPAGGSTVTYQPLTRRLPDSVPVYGVERREGSLAERAAEYVADIRRYADGYPVILGGWSFGGALAYEVASQLQGTDVDVKLIALLDTVQPSTPIPDTPEETRARWQRYAAFAKKTYDIDFPIPLELLDSAGEDAVLGMIQEFLATADASAHGLSAAVLQHQHHSFVDNRILDKLDFRRWENVQVPVVLYKAERMHDGAIELEPHYAEIDPDGGWSAIVEDLDIVQLRGDHLGVVDEPEIGKVGADLTRRIKNLS